MNPLASVKSARTKPVTPNSSAVRRAKMNFLIKMTIAFIAFTSVANAQTNAPTAWTPELQMKVKSVGSARVSPDGKRVMYTVVDAVMTPDKSEFVTQIWLATTDGKDNYQIT